MSALRPTTTRRLWAPGIVFEGETEAEAAERERQWRAEDARLDAELDRLWAWKQRPWWEDPK